MNAQEQALYELMSDRAMQAESALRVFADCSSLPQDRERARKVLDHNLELTAKYERKYPAASDRP